MRWVGVGAFLLLVVAGIVSAIGYAASLPRSVALVALVCLAAGAVGTAGAGFANARANEETVARSIARAVRDTLRLVFELVP